MPNTKHSSGPWIACANKQPFGMTSILRLDSAGTFRQVADCRADHCDTEEAEQNARLIAAAPELLAACLRLMQIAEACERDPNWPGNTPDSGGAASIEFARAAIAKAVRL